ncbi:MAG: hypothetical protein IT270_03170 [Saprospiraceae bacterium]|nr:hypothetical protein [Saprospiraceae bacterium]
MDLVFNEWFLEWHRPDASMEEKQKVRCLTDWLLKNEHRLVVLKKSPFINKLNDFRRIYSSGFTGIALKTFYTSIVLNSDNCLLIEEPPALPTETTNLLSVGNYKSDTYLFESAYVSADKIIVTTDEKLRKQFENQQLFQLWSVDELMKHFNIPC